jgi:phosphinothricin acetyltransferase
MVEIVQLKEATEQAVEELVALGRELHSDKRSMSFAELQELVGDESAVLMTVQDNGHIVGMATLYIIPKIGRRNALFEDLIVDSKYRGQGLGVQLMQSVIDAAKQRNVNSITLLSSAHRVAAHSLYEKLGFSLVETNVFKLKL